MGHIAWRKPCCNLAADNSDIAAVVANVPGLDLFRGIRGRFKPIGFRPTSTQIAAATIRLLAAACWTPRRCGRTITALIAVYGPLGHAVFSDPALAERFREVEENAPTWRNQVTPRFLFTAPRYRDGTMERIAVPLMVTLARDDAVISSAFVKETAAKAPRHEIREYPVGHFDMYHGPVRDQVAADQLAFLQRHLIAMLPRLACPFRGPDVSAHAPWPPRANGSTSPHRAGV